LRVIEFNVDNDADFLVGPQQNLVNGFSGFRVDNEFFISHCRVATVRRDPGDVVRAWRARRDLGDDLGNAFGLDVPLPIPVRPLRLNGRRVTPVDPAEMADLLTEVARRHLRDFTDLFAPPKSPPVARRFRLATPVARGANTLAYATRPACNVSDTGRACDPGRRRRPARRPRCADRARLTVMPNASSSPTTSGLSGGYR
jgi:hypothetical protein